MKIHLKQKARQRIWPSQQQKKKTQSLKNDENPPKAKKLGKGYGHRNNKRKRHKV